MVGSSSHALTNSVAADDGQLRGLMTRVLQTAAARQPIAADDVSRLLSCSPSAIIELTHSWAPLRRADPDAVQSLFRDLLQVLAAAVVLTESIHAAGSWMRYAQLPEFDGRTAMDIIVEGRAADVCHLIEMYDAGPAG